MGLRLIVGCEPCACPAFAVSRLSPEFVPEPQPMSTAKQRLISPRPIDLQTSEAHVVFPTVFCRHTRSVVKTMMFTRSPVVVDEMRSKPGVVPISLAETTVSR